MFLKPQYHDCFHMPKHSKQNIIPFIFAHPPKLNFLEKLLITFKGNFFGEFIGIWTAIMSIRELPYPIPFNTWSSFKAEHGEKDSINRIHLEDMDKVYLGYSPQGLGTRMGGLSEITE